jgi:hypothetical protein
MNGRKTMSEMQKPPGRATPPRTPRWVIAFVVILILLVVVVVIVHLMGFRFDHGTGAIFFNRVVSLTEQAIQYGRT